MTTAETSASATSLESKPRHWGLLLIQGIVMIILGAILLWAPAKARVETYQLLVMLLGIYWIVAGVLDLVHMFTDHSAWGWKLFMGIISILAGIWIVAYPVAAGIALPRIFALVLGIWGLIQGFSALILAFKGGGWGMGILGVIGIILGVFLIVNWDALGMGLAIVWAAAIWMFIGGFFVIYRAYQVRKVNT